MNKFSFTFLISLLLIVFPFFKASAYMMNITIGSKTLSVDMVSNKATEELLELLKKGDVTVQLHEYGGFERVGSLPQSLTTSNENINAQCGEVILYLGNQIVFMLGSNSWSYTRLGYIKGATRNELESFFGPGNSTVILSIENNAVIETTIEDKDTYAVYYDLTGRQVTADHKGILLKKTQSGVVKIFNR